MTTPINYGNPNLTSVPEPGAIERDLTRATLVLDMENALGETFHWEVGPDDQREIATRSSNSPADKNGKVFVQMTATEFFHPDVARNLRRPFDTQAEKV